MPAPKCSALKREIQELKKKKRRAASPRNNPDTHDTIPKSLDEFVEGDAQK